MRMVLLALIVASGVAAASAQQDAPRVYEATRSSESYRRAVLETYTSYETSLSTHCPKVDVNMNTSDAKVLGPFVTDANGSIVSGHWRETTEGTACGEKRLYNASVVIRDGKSQVLSLFPGHSYASAVLQRDGVQYAAVGAGAGQGCMAEVLDTVLPDGEPSGPKLPWVEKWTVRACGKRSVVTMHFVPDATGTTINVALKETVALP
ncbi:hypothetical protein [Granulicella arctica]|uniref:hypothetical protein n=1 Tax=Granulicella arctica TaxID=940613 RepID=UPI0021DF7242|nr:hypothetical protein [Granulicella arctica]